MGKYILIVLVTLCVATLSLVATRIIYIKNNENVDVKSEPTQSDPKKLMRNIPFITSCIKCYWKEIPRHEEDKMGVIFVDEVTAQKYREKYTWAIYNGKFPVYNTYWNLDELSDLPPLHLYKSAEFERDIARNCATTQHSVFFDMDRGIIVFEFFN